jgi:hypothetical protein
MHPAFSDLDEGRGCPFSGGPQVANLLSPHLGA